MTNQEQALPQQEMAENPAPFTHAKQVGFNLEDVILNTKNEVALLYPEHSNKEVFLSNALDNSKRMKDGYGDGDVTIHPTQIFSVNNWALKSNQPEGPPFTDHMMAICNAEKPVAFKAPKPSSNAERIPQDTKPEAKPGHKKHSTSKQPPVSSSEVTKGGSFKAPTGSKTGHLKRKKESNSAMDFNPSQTSASTLVVAEMHKEDQQATGGPTSLGVTSEAKANPQLSSDKTKFVNVWLETVLTKPKTGTTNVAKTSKEIKFRAIKLEDLAKLVPNVKVDFKNLDSPEDDSINVVDDSKGNGEEDKNEEIHSNHNEKPEDISDSTPPSPRSIQLQELKNQVFLLQSQKHTLEIEKKKVEAEITRLKAQPSFPYVGRLNELPFASGCDVSTDSIAKADIGLSSPSDFIPQQQEKGASSVARQIEEETSSTIKLEDLAKLVSHVKPSFKDMDSPKDDPVIIVDDTDEDEENEIHATTNDELKIL
ncbi:hypothetical protein Tco_1335601 [Tanacetum coccineum]